MILCAFQIKALAFFHCYPLASRCCEVGPLPRKEHQAISSHLEEL